MVNIEGSFYLVLYMRSVYCAWAVEGRPRPQLSEIRSSTRRASRKAHLGLSARYDPASLFSEGSEVTTLYIEGSLTIPKYKLEGITMRMLKIA